MSRNGTRANTVFQTILASGAKGAAVSEIARLLYGRDSAAACRAASGYALTVCRTRGRPARQINRRIYLLDALDDGGVRHEND